MNIIRIALVSTYLLIIGCASNPMVISSSQTVEIPSSNTANVVFIRSTFMGSAIAASLYDVTSGEPRFIGIIANNTKVAHKTSPGKHTFMVVSEAADFMEANLSGGKTYYSIVTPRMGAWKARFSLWPIRKGTESKHNTQIYKKIMTTAPLVENSPSSEQWYLQNKNSVATKYKKYLPVWEQKTPQALAERTLNPEDGS